MDPIGDILGPGGLLAAAIPGWEHRPEQLAVARAVAAALADEHALLVEAGTGTGKTLAYLVPALLSGKRVIVSTGTRTLQEQLHERDLPLLARHLGVPFTAAVLKGIGNYVCQRRLAEVSAGGDPDLARILAWARATQGGDRAELAAVAEDAAAWAEVLASPESRLGPRCPFYDRCFVTRARRAAAQADLVVVNHHLYFADLALRAAYAGAQVLPDHQVVIFDEAHQVEEVATEHFGCTASTTRLAGLLRDATRVLVSGAVPLLGESGAASAPRPSRERSAASEAVIARVERLGEDLFARVRAALGSVAAEGGRVTLPADLLADVARDAWLRLDAGLEELALSCAHVGDDDEAAAAIARRADALRADLAELAEGDARRAVRWAEVRGRTLHLRASPVDVAPLLRERVLGAVPTAIFTSATLTAGGRFDYLRTRLGLEDETVAELAVGSPFDYARQALLYLPRDIPRPEDPGFPAAALEEILAQCEITQGRALVLFTSWRALHHAARVLRPRLRLPLLVQGEAPRGALLDALRGRVGSVLLATSSFWEGVDVPGEALSLVILEKLPFSPPDDPLHAARAAALEERGLDPFQAFTLPRAALALKQGFGRLIRRRDDRGIVAILDQRILTRAYGEVFLRSLPPAARTSSIEQVRRWW